MKSNGYTKLINCKILRDHQLLHDQLWVKDGKIINPHEAFYVNKLLPATVIDCKGAIVSPGFIDLQINGEQVSLCQQEIHCHFSLSFSPFLPSGGFGYDFSDAISCNASYLEDALQVVSKGVLAHGVTSFCPTLITQSAESYKKSIPRIARTFAAKDRANILGCHLEGPFISRDKKGAHPEQYVISEPVTSIDQVTHVYGDDLTNVAMITLAPEKIADMQIIGKLKSLGVSTVAIGHTSAQLKFASAAVEAGARFITHLFNAMSPFKHRDPGPIGLISDTVTSRKVHYGIIADGLHMDQSAINLVFRANPEKLVLVTDALSALGLTTGSKLKIGTQTIEVKDNGAYVAGTETLAGSITPMIQCVRNLRHFTKCSIVEALECATLHPARVLGIQHRKGSLHYGCDADFILLDDNLNLLSTFVYGNQVWALNSTPQIQSQ